MAVAGRRRRAPDPNGHLLSLAPAPHEEIQDRHHQRVGIVQQLSSRTIEVIQLGLARDTCGDQLGPHAADEFEPDSASGITKGIDVHARFDANLTQPRLLEQLEHSPADKGIGAVNPKPGHEDVVHPLPRRVWRVIEIDAGVRLHHGYPASRTDQPDHLGQDCLRSTQVDQQGASVDQVKGTRRGTGRARVPLDDLDVGQPGIPHKCSCELYVRRLAVKADYRTGPADPLAQEVDYAKRSATHVDRALARTDGDSVEQVFAMDAQLLCLAQQASALGLRCSQRVHGWPERRGSISTALPHWGDFTSRGAESQLVGGAQAFTGMLRDLG